MKAGFTEVVARLDSLIRPGLVYEPGTDFESWHRQFMLAIAEIRGASVPRVPLQWYFVGERTDLGSCWAQDVRICATAVSEASGFLLTPKEPTRDGATVIATHGHHPRGKHAVAGHPREGAKPGDDVAAYGWEAVCDGYVVFVPDWWGWGDHSEHLHLIGNRDRCNVIQMAASMYGVSVLNLHLAEADAIVEFLLEQPQVDSSRIGVMGNSYGGRTAMWIAALNGRIRCTVSAGAMNLFRERASKLSSCALQSFPGLLRYGDVGEVYSLIAPRPLQLQAGTDDPLVNPPDRQLIVDRVVTAYRAAGSLAELSVEVFTGGHALHWPAAREFLANHL